MYSHWAEAAVDGKNLRMLLIFRTHSALSTTTTFDVQVRVSKWLVRPLQSANRAVRGAWHSFDVRRRTRGMDAVMLVMYSYKFCIEKSVGPVELSQPESDANGFNPIRARPYWGL